MRRSSGILFLANSQKRKGNINLCIQKMYISKKYPYAKCKIIDMGNCLQCNLSLQPTALSPKYSVKVIYFVNSTPAVYVRELLKKTGLPHVYKGNKLCLYYPGSGEWNHRSILADTIIPWASEWLFYYELWSITGEWHGGGKHAEDKEAISEQTRDK